jgi:hypothetical protein
MTSNSKIIIPYRSTILSGLLYPVVSRGVSTAQQSPTRLGQSLVGCTIVIFKASITWLLVGVIRRLTVQYCGTKSGVKFRVLLNYKWKRKMVSQLLYEKIGKKKVKLSLYQAMDDNRVVRRRGSHIF